MPYQQVYHGLRDGVQDVAVKVLFETDERALRTFIQVLHASDDLRPCTSSQGSRHLQT